MSNYIDLAEQIENAESWIPDGVEIRATLDWLDEHPDQVPGRTITQSEFRDAYSAFGDMDGPDCYGSLLDLLGITVTPDPKPTNADKLEALLEGGDINAQWGLRGGGVMFARELAHALDEAGVKAPGVER